MRNNAQNLTSPWHIVYQYTLYSVLCTLQVLHGCRQLVAWAVGLSPRTSATLVLSCSKNWKKLSFNFLHSQKTAGDRLEEGEDDVKSAWPLWAGLHTCYNGDHNGMQRCESERILKNRLSSDCCLQLDNMKMESLVIADQHAAVNTYPGLVHTARHTMGINFARSFQWNEPQKKIQNDKI